MRIHLLVLLLSIYRLNGHGQHGSNSHQASPGGQPSHISRKMEDYVHDINHIKHDLQGQVNKPIEQMTSEEQNFYYFKLHDTNNDNRLDGLEVIAAFDHVHDEEYLYDEPTNGTNSTQIERLPDEELINLIDDILKEEDMDRDGFISYEEFKHALEKEKMS